MCEQAYGAKTDPTPKSRSHETLTMIEVSARPVPSNDGGGLDQREGVSSSAPESPENHPEDAIKLADAGSGCGAAENRDLLSKGDVLQFQVELLDEEGAEQEQHPRLIGSEARGEPQDRPWRAGTESPGATGGFELAIRKRNGLKR
jgi:hypothetical protein